MPTGKDDKTKDDERRDYFRVDDIISVIAKPVDIIEGNEEIIEKLKSTSAFSLNDHKAGLDDREDEFSGTPDNRKLYEMMTEIKTKLDFIINRFMLEKEGLNEFERKMVNISASGIRFTVDNEVKSGDILEIKLLLPTYPPVAVFAYGKIIRATKLDNGKYDVAVEYINMSDTVKDEIVKYTLNNQREMISSKKESREHEKR